MLFAASFDFLWLGSVLSRAWCGRSQHFERVLMEKRETAMGLLWRNSVHKEAKEGRKDLVSVLILEAFATA